MQEKLEFEKAGVYWTEYNVDSSGQMEKERQVHIRSYFDQLYSNHIVQEVEACTSECWGRDGIISWVASVILKQRPGVFVNNTRIDWVLMQRLVNG